MPTARPRREAERRRLQRQVQRRREREAARRRFAIIASVIGTVLVIGLVVTLIALTTGKKSTPAAARSTAAAPHTSSAVASPAPTASTSSAAAAPSYPCTWTKGGAASKKASLPSTTRPPKTGTVTVSVRTTRGPMTFRLDRALAPCTVASFVSLVKQGYYDKTPCHRLVTSGIYVLQCGDPSGTGGGGPGYSIPDEGTGKETYPAGTIAMARTSQPHSGGSQFFIVYKSSPSLQQGLGKLQYTVFGNVASGLNVVQKVAAGGVAAGGNSATDGKPKLPITITAAKAGR